MHMVMYPIGKQYLGVLLKKPYHSQLHMLSSVNVWPSRAFLYGPEM